MKSGIYRIYNTANEKCYIGQSVDILKRLRKHKEMLSSGKHDNDHLQKAWDKYGPNAFLFEVVEHCPKEELDERETFYIGLMKTTDRKHGYNIMSGGQARHDCPEEIRRKISKRNKGVSRPWSDSHKKAASDNWHNIHKPLPKETIKRATAKRKAKLSTDGQNNGNAVITDAQAERFITEMLNGETPVAIAEREGLTRDILYNLYHNRSYKHILTDRRHELTERYTNAQKARAEKCIELYKNGWSMNKIAKTLNMSRNTISREVKAVMICPH